MSSTENNAEVAVEKQVDAVEAEEKKEKAEVKGAKRPAEVCIFFSFYENSVPDKMPYEKKIWEIQSG